MQMAFNGTCHAGMWQVLHVWAWLCKIEQRPCAVQLFSMPIEHWALSTIALYLYRAAPGPVRPPTPIPHCHQPQPSAMPCHHHLHLHLHSPRSHPGTATPAPAPAAATELLAARNPMRVASKPRLPLPSWCCSAIPCSSTQFGHSRHSLF
jgi:hypothetical protein